MEFLVILGSITAVALGLILVIIAMYFVTAIWTAILITTRHYSGFYKIDPRVMWYEFTRLLSCDSITFTCRKTGRVHKYGLHK